MPESDHEVLLRVQWEQEAMWRKADELEKNQREHHLEDDARFDALSAKFDGLSKQYTAILTSIVVACIVLIVNAAVIWAKVGK